MPTIQLPSDFSEFLKLLNAHDVRYLIVGGYAVAYHGYPRSTGDIDVWIDTSAENAEGVYQALLAFGFNVPALTPELFTEADRVIRMGHPPLRIEVLTTISGVDFASCYPQRVKVAIDDLVVPFISLSDLKTNKQASGRLKDRDDIERLP